MRVLVTGGREFDGYALIAEVLDDIHIARGITLLIHGDCNNPDSEKYGDKLVIEGADQLAARWARKNHVPYLSHPANWKNGKAGGPIRNGEMLAQWRPQMVVAFPGGSGTANMVKQAVTAGLLLRDERGRGGKP